MVDCNIIKEYLIEKLNNIKELDKCTLKAECIYCGKSKHDIPHMKISISKNFFYCFRCNSYGNLTKLLKDLKAPKEIYQDIKVSLIDDKIKEKNYNLDGNYQRNIIYPEFIARRILIDEKEVLNSVFVNKFNIYSNEERKELGFLTYNGKVLNVYKFLEDNGYKKFKIKVKDLSVPDFYFINSSRFNYKNLIITEGVFDLLTMYYHYHFYIKGDYLAMLGKSLKVVNFLKYLGKLYYENIFLVLDNDVNFEFTSKIISVLKPHTENLYIIKPKPQFIDINQQLIELKSIKDVSIEKITF